MSSQSSHAPARSLVLGGCGFLGSHLCERLLDMGHEVLCADSLVTGHKSNITHLESNPAFEFLRHDVTYPLHVETDRIWNLACPASPIHYQRDPVQTTRTAVLGAINMLDLARETGARIFQASTSEIYGDPKVHPQPESYKGNVSPIGPRSCYDEGKRCAETLFFDYHRQYGLDIRVARIFNTYGPRMQPDDGRVISNFITQALRNQPITIYGNGNQTRSFCYVDDLIDVIIAMMQAGEEATGPINIGNPSEITMVELANQIRHLTGSTSEIVYEPPASDDPRQRQPDISLATATLDWTPRIGLTEGLERTIAYFRKRIG